MAAAAAVLLMDERHHEPTYTISGPAAIMYRDVAANLSAATGHNIMFVHIPDEAAHAALRDSGAPPWLAANLVAPFPAAPGGHVVWVGEGWRSLIEECHARLVEVFPDYELLNVKQKHGVLAFQAFPRMNQGQQRWSSAELDALESITEEFASWSETLCEWCGTTAVLRTWRTLELTLCDDCDERFLDPPTNAASTQNR